MLLVGEWKLLIFKIKCPDMTTYQVFNLFLSFLSLGSMWSIDRLFRIVRFFDAIILSRTHALVCSKCVNKLLVFEKADLSLKFISKE